MKRISLLMALVVALTTGGLVRADLTHHWKVDETSLIWDGTNWIGVLESVTSTEGRLWGYDSSFDLTQNGVGVLGNPGPVGGGDTAYDLEVDSGISGVATLVTGAVPATADFTALAWIMTTNPHTAQGHVFSNNNGQTGRAGLFVLNGQAAFWAQGFTAGQIDSITRVDDGIWHEIGVARSNGTFSLLVDGVVEDTFDGPAVSIDQGTYWMIGRQRSYAGNYEGLVGDVKVYNTGYSLAPRSRAWNPYPERGATGIDPGTGSVTLSWNTQESSEGVPDPTIVTHKLYVSDGTDPTPQFVADIAVTGATANRSVSISFDEEYYWRVDEVAEYPADDPNTFTGFTWRFSTLASLPMLTGPEDLLIFPDETATFTVEISSLTTVTDWQWYKYVDGVSDTPLATGEDITITNSQMATTLQIANTAGEDEGEYYVAVTNAAGATTTNRAHLLLKKLLGYWPLNGDTFDASGEGNEGTLINDVTTATDPNWVAGISGQAFNAFGTNWIEIANESAFDNFSTLTVSTWVKSTQLQAYTPFVSKHGYIIGWTLGAGSGPDIANFITRNDGSYLRYGPFLEENVGLNDGTWHHLVAVLDGPNSQRRLYVDGLLADTLDYDPAQMIQNDIPVRIAANQFNDVNDGRAIATIDEVKIYNYPLDPLTIAQEYASLSGNSVCYDRPDLDTTGPNGEPDCLVNLYEFSEFVTEWLDCGSVPDCLP